MSAATVRRLPIISSLHFSAADLSEQPGRHHVGGHQRFLHEIRAFIPQEALDIIEQYLIYVGRDSSPRLLWFSLVFSVYFPYRAAGSLMVSVRRAYGEHKPTQFVRHQLKLLLYTLSLILMIVLSIGLSVVGGRVLNFCSEHLSGYIALSDGFISLWSGLRFAILGGIVFFPTAMMYGLAQESRKMNRIWPGAVFSLVMWLVLSFLFSYYVEKSRAIPSFTGRSAR